MGYIIIFVTAKDKKEAERIGLRLVSEKLVACVNIIPNLVSIFRWKRKIERAKEALLLIKTSSRLQPIVFKRIRQLHSYEVPEIIGVPIKFIDRKYLGWLDENITHEK